MVWMLAELPRNMYVKQTPTMSQVGWKDSVVRRNTKPKPNPKSYPSSKRNPNPMSYLFGVHDILPLFLEFTASLALTALFPYLG